MAAPAASAELAPPARPAAGSPGSGGRVRCPQGVEHPTGVEGRGDPGHPVVAQRRHPVVERLVQGLGHRPALLVEGDRAGGGHDRPQLAEPELLAGRAWADVARSFQVARLTAGSSSSAMAKMASAFAGGASVPAARASARRRWPGGRRGSRPGAAARPPAAARAPAWPAWRCGGRSTPSAGGRAGPTLPDGVARRAVGPLVGPLRAGRDGAGPREPAGRREAPSVRPAPFATVAPAPPVAALAASGPVVWVPAAARSRCQGHRHVRTLTGHAEHLDPFDVLVRGLLGLRRQHSDHVDTFDSGLDFGPVDPADRGVGRDQVTAQVPLGWRAPAARQVQVPSAARLVSSISMRRGISAVTLVPLGGQGRTNRPSRRHGAGRPRPRRVGSACKVAPRPGWRPEQAAARPPVRRTRRSVREDGNA